MIWTHSHAAYWLVPFIDKSANPLTVILWPKVGEMSTVELQQESPPDQNTWVRAQVTFNNVMQDFLLMLRAQGPEAMGAKLTLAVDRVKVTTGKCGDED